MDRHAKWELGELCGPKNERALSALGTTSENSDVNFVGTLSLPCSSARADGRDTTHSKSRAAGAGKGAGKGEGKGKGKRKVKEKGAGPRITRTDIGTYSKGAAFVLHDFLTAAECEHYIAQAEEAGMTSVMGEGYRSKMRRNDRAIVLSLPVAEELTARVLPFVGDITIEPNEYGYAKYQEGIVPESHPGVYTPYGCNPGIRVCRYTKGGHFQPHFDGQFRVSDTNLSYKTFMLYLNDGFEGKANSRCCPLRPRTTPFS